MVPINPRRMIRINKIDNFLVFFTKSPFSDNIDLLRSALNNWQIYGLSYRFGENSLQLVIL